MPWHSVLLSFFPFLLHQPSRSSNISHVMFLPVLLQMLSQLLSSAGFMPQSYLKWRVWVSSPKHSAGSMSQSEQHQFCSLFFSLLVVFVWLGFCPSGRASFQCIWLPVHLSCGVTQLSVWNTESLCSPRRGDTFSSSKYLCSSAVGAGDIDISSFSTHNHICSLLVPCASTHWSMCGCL